MRAPTVYFTSIYKDGIDISHKSQVLGTNGNRVLAQGAPTGLVPDTARDEDVQPVGWLSRLIKAGS